MAIELIGCRDNPIILAEIILDQQADGNTFNLIQNPCAFQCEAISYWFSNCKNMPPHLPAPTEGQYIIESLTHNPTKLEYGETFSTRGTIKLCMHDLPDCNGEGYWLSKFIAKQKFFKNRVVNIYTGTCDQPLECLHKETYLIDYVDQIPDADCRICFTLKDPLSITENATCPNKPEELTVLRMPYELDSVGDSTADNNPFEHMGKLLFPEGYTEQEVLECILPAKYICIGDELIRVEPEETATGWNLKLIDRGACDTPIGSHSLGSEFSIPQLYNRTHVTTVIEDLIKRCIDIETVFSVCCPDGNQNIIDWQSFDIYKCENPYHYICDTVICKPVRISQLLKELAQVFLFTLYYDSDTGTIKIKSIKPPNCGDPEVETITECMLAKDSFSRSKSYDSYNRVVIYHTLRNCTGEPSKDNLTEYKASINTESLFDICEQHGQKGVNTLELSTRFINSCNAYVAAASADRWLALRSCDGLEVRISVLKEVADCFALGDFLKIEHDKIRNYLGEFDDSFWYMKGKSHAGYGCVDITIERLNYDRTWAHCFSECCGPPECCDVPAVAFDFCTSNECLGIW